MFIVARGIFVEAFSSCVWALEHVGCCPAACGMVLPQPEIEPTSPALEGWLPTTGPPGKSPRYYVE